MNGTTRARGTGKWVKLVSVGWFALGAVACGEATPGAEHPDGNAGHPTGEAGCEHQGSTRAVGERWNDGCNDCFCGDDGLVSCTEKACPPTGPDPSSDADCTSAADCPEGHACFPQSGCEGRGQCARKPDACTAHYDPVCGCDGKTYGNACSAATYGVAVASSGECPSK